MRDEPDALQDGRCRFRFPAEDTPCHKLPNAFRFMTRGLGTQETRSNDILSVLMFQPDYLRRLLELGYADAETRREEIAAFFVKSYVCPDPATV